MKPTARLIDVALRSVVYWLPKGRSKARSAIGIRILSSTIHLSQAGALAADTAAP